MATISAGQLLTTAEQEALAQVFRKAQGPAISSFFLALCGNAASGSFDNTWTTASQITEFGATAGYSRQVFGPTTPTVASPSVISNTAVITFGPVSGSITGTPIVWGVGTDNTGAGAGGTAKLMAAFLLATARTPISGDSLQAAASAFTCQV
jgi:hypothetical protein